MAPLYVILAVFEGFDPSPRRLVRPEVAKALIPALMLGYIAGGTAIGAQDKTDDKAVKDSEKTKAVQGARQQTVDKDVLPIEQSLERCKNPDTPMLKTVLSQHRAALLWPAGLFGPGLGGVSPTPPPPPMHAFLQYDMVVSATALLTPNELFSVWKLRQMGHITTSRAFLAVLGVVAGQPAYRWAWCDLGGAVVLARGCPG
ncbi:hypothetical protein diail_2102 [Diaporthe ilicicola]|nr:hypothetical protein diail_2102 [Diaporthe ilicicola]